MPLAKTVICYSHPDQPIYAVEHLDELKFNLGFRILNPEYRCTFDELKKDAERFREDFQIDDTIPENYIPNHNQTPRQRYLIKNPGLDRSTPPEIY